MGAVELIRWITRASPLIIARWAIDIDQLKTTPHSSMIKKG